MAAAASLMSWKSRHGSARERAVAISATRSFNLVKLGQIEPARANAAIYGLSTFLGSRKIAEDLSDRRRVEEMEGRVRELIEQIDRRPSRSSVAPVP